ncbi:MAG: hypothetical protein COA43_05595 [Robiginitomaculum sp.]|nr:MAG: hypothetical protein COA43_05595 [Robiginitomaculum sp.]
MNSKYKLSFVSALGGGLLGGLIISVLMLFVILPKFTHQLLNTDTAQPGMDILAAYSCPRGETKNIYLRGIEDGFSQNEQEPSRIHERLMGFESMKHVAKHSRDYDEFGNDKTLVDYFEIPKNISKGQFLISLKALNQYSNNDSITFNNYLELDFDTAITHRYFMSMPINNLPQSPFWQQYGETLFSVSLDQLILSKNTITPKNINTILDYIQNGVTPQDISSILDVAVQDDTVVDFMAVTVCEKPLLHMGMTFTESTGYKNIARNISILSCDQDPTQRFCNPITGDTLCSTPLPLACFKPDTLTLPDILKESPGTARLWTGSHISYSTPVRGDQFKTIADANQACATQFGHDWRVASHHDGVPGSLYAQTTKRIPKQRLWIDIKDQPYGTCWARQ